MSTFVYQPKGTCSTEMRFELEGETIQSLEVVNGCNGNLKGIASLLKGQNVNEVIERLDGITCGRRPTSCPDQIAQALKSYKATL
ncbi:MAG: TIGR03905 family TSCPD domain-containing protein [Solobacterium sp.]|nr:TIGR03905 family TSCPD domain-containing protein [Solobacterium sp.]